MMTPSRLSTAGGERTLTELDHVRLRRWSRRDDADASLAELLDLATVVPSREVQPHIVTLYSQVLLAPLPAGAPLRVTLCYPDDAEPAAGFVSVLSPLGSALLGLPVGAHVTWQGPTGQVARAELRAILFQPEASGDFTL